jgi:bacterioferritin-associated ferredoxin
VIICLCKEISDRVIYRLLEQGIDNFKALQDICDAGKGCGKCVCAIKTIIHEKTGLHHDNGCARSETSLGRNEKEHDHGYENKRPRNYRFIK